MDRLTNEIARLFYGSDGALANLQPCMVSLFFRSSDQASCETLQNVRLEVIELIMLAKLAVEPS